MARSPWRIAIALVVLAGCPRNADPDPVEEYRAKEVRSAAPDKGSLYGKWFVEVRSDAPGLNPDTVDTPEARAKMFFAHRARIDSGKLVVEHKTLKKNFIGTPANARELEYLVTETDWNTVKRTADQESVGGTVFTFIVSASDGPLEIKTSNLDAHPELRRIVEILKETAGVP